jgi:hypothetical protein
MSHNKLTLAGQSPNKDGELSIGIDDLSSFTPTTNKMLGIDSNIDLVQLDQPSQSSTLSWNRVFNYYSLPSSYGANYPIDTDDSDWSGTLNARISSGVYYINSTYISTSAPGSDATKWATHYTVQPGTYLFNACFMSDVRTSSDRCIVSLLNRTDSTRHGNKGYWGAQQYSNNMYAHVTIDEEKEFTWSIESITGAPYFVSATAILAVHLNIWRL